MEVRFALEIKVEVIQGRGCLVDQVLINIQIDDTFVAGKGVHATGAFRAMQVAAVSRFDRQADRVSPVMNPAGYPGKQITGDKVDQVNRLGQQRNYDLRIQL
jgi:hypothetical protein